MEHDDAQSEQAAPALISAKVAPLVGLSAEEAKLLEALKTALSKGSISIEHRTRCRCQSERFEQLCAHDRFGLPFSTVLCLDCGLVQQRERIAQKDREKYRTRFGLLDPEPRLELDLNLLKAPHPREALYVGSKTCALFDIAQSHATEIANATESYDLIIADGVLERAFELDEAILKLKANLNSGGLIYVRAMGLRALHSRTDIWFQYQRYRSHSQNFDLELSTLTSAMADHGLALCTGDESIAAVFQDSTERKSFDAPSADATRAYLLLCEQNREHWTQKELELREGQAQLRHLRAELSAKETEISQLQERLERMRDSTSWRVTDPLRRLTARAKKLRGLLS